MKIDNLNTISIKSYFEEMPLPQSEISLRVRLAERFKYLFESWFYLDEIEEIEIDDLILLLYDDMFEIVSDEIEITEKNIERIDKMSKEIIETTVKYQQEDVDYGMSDDRAFIIAVNEAQAHANINQFEIAKQRGFKNKVWLTTLDERARETHLLADMQTVPIDEPFIVGGSKLMFPMDISLGASAEEIINCRCTMQYTR